jgi:hypothetical protein
VVVSVVRCVVATSPLGVIVVPLLVVRVRSVSTPLLLVVCWLLLLQLLVGAAGCGTAVVVVVVVLVEDVCASAAPLNIPSAARAIRVVRIMFVAP